MNTAVALAWTRAKQRHHYLTAVHTGLADGTLKTRHQHKDGSLLPNGDHRPFQILNRRLQGASFATIAKELGISRERPRQILYREYYEDYTDIARRTNL